jgi:type II secretory pathway component PulK
VRLMITDESGKININSLLSDSTSPYANPYAAQAQSGEQAGQGQTTTDGASFWKTALQELFLEAGFVREQYTRDQVRTLGNIAFAPEEQVAVIHDWIDTDSTSHSSASFPGQGIESSADKIWFFNRPLRTLSELALVPGMTLERVGRIAPFVRTSQMQNNRINVNTAPLEVLLAIGIPEAQAQELFTERTNLPITPEMLQQIVAGDAQLGRITTVTSQEFSAYAWVKMANVTRWARAVINVQGGPNSRKATISAIEIL